MILNSVSVVVLFLNPHKNPINIGIGGNRLFLVGTFLDLHLEECLNLKLLVTMAFICLIIDCGTPLNAIN